MDILCNEIHPSTKYRCILPAQHIFADDARERQHVTMSGYKWPDLRTLDPSEGFNGPQPHLL